MSQEQLFDPKQLNQNYTIGIIKPNIVLETEKLKQILDFIENSGELCIKNIIQRQLYKEQAMNLYYKHETKPYFNDIVEYMTSGECCVLVLCCAENKEDGEKGTAGDPIALWKKMIGAMDPELAKKNNPQSLRAKYGKSMIKNEFGGSDNAIQANKQRKIFNFRIPQHPPPYTDDPYKITLQSLKQFLHPANLQHVCLNERMDILGLYGPVVNWHSIEQCFCSNCRGITRQVAEKIKIKTKKKVVKILKQQDVRGIYEQLCQSCRNHCDNFTHLAGGRQMQHILTDNQIKQLALQLNKSELIEMLTIEKGSTAKTMIEKIQIKQPKQIQYNMQLFEILLEQIQSDYYNRYQFTQLQNLILEDRRIRITYWISKLTGKPIDRFPPVTSLDNTLTVKQLRDPKSVFFTLVRKLPLTLLIKTENIKNVPLNFNPSIVDKNKLYHIEENLKMEKLLHRNLTKVMTVGNNNENQKEKGSSIRDAVTLLRPYNEGRHGDWNNYAGLTGNSVKGEIGGKNMNSFIKGNK